MPMLSSVDEADVGIAKEEPITHDVLMRALHHILGMGLSDEELSGLAYYILNFFGFDDYVIDNILTPKDRDVFYTLEEKGLLGTLQEEVFIKRGKLWRIHYWVLRRENIIRYASIEPDEKKSDYSAIYEHLSDEIWEHHD